MAQRPSVRAFGPGTDASVPSVPAVCGFCGDDLVVAWFQGPDFVTFADAPDRVTAGEAWLACATCLALVESDEREELVWRGVARLRWRAGLGTESAPMEAIVRQMHERFWAARPV